MSQLSIGWTALFSVFLAVAASSLLPPLCYPLFPLFHFHIPNYICLPSSGKLSCPNRAIRSSWILLQELNQIYRPAIKSWRLNERMYVPRHSYPCSLYSPRNRVFNSYLSSSISWLPPSLCCYSLSVTLLSITLLSMTLLSITYANSTSHLYIQVRCPGGNFEASISQWVGPRAGKSLKEKDEKLSSDSIHLSASRLSLYCHIISSIDDYRSRYGGPVYSSGHQTWMTHTSTGTDMRGSTQTSTLPSFQRPNLFKIR